LIAGIREQFQVSERLACRVLALRRSVHRYQSQPNRDGEVIKLLLELAHGRPEQGFGKLFKRLRRLGYARNHKRVYRVYCALEIEQTTERQKTAADQNTGAPLQVSAAVNECWSADFMSDALWSGQRFHFQRSRRFQSRSVGHRSGLQRAWYARLRLDNGPELISVTLADWAEQHGVTLEFIKPGKPMQICVHLRNHVMSASLSAAFSLHLSFCSAATSSTAPREK